MILYILLLVLDWPMYGNDLCNTHEQEGKGAMTSATVKWSYNTGGSGQLESAPTLADINNDGYLEIIGLVHLQKKAYTLDHTGSLLWSYSMGGYLLLSCATADIDGDSYDEVIIGSWDNKVYVVNHDGSFLWSYVTGGRAFSPTVVDIDGDSQYEIIVGSNDNKVYAINHDGSLLWSYVSGGVAHVPAVADIDGDGQYEIIIGGDKVYALNHDGSLLWSYAAGGTALSAVVADIDGDSFYEIVFGSYDGNVYALSHGGTFLWSYAIGNVGDERQIPAVADIDKDGYKEVVFGSYNMSTGKLYAINYDGTLCWSFDILGGVHCAPAIADVDGDGWHEILSPKITSAGTSELYCLNHDGTICWTITLQRDIHDVAIGDIDCDSCLEIVVGTYDDNYIYVIDDPLNTSGCTPMSIEENKQFKTMSLEFKAIGKEIYLFTPKAIQVDINIYDVCGRLQQTIYKGVLSKGGHTFISNIQSSGVYFATLQSRNFKQSLKLIRF